MKCPVFSCLEPKEWFFFFFFLGWVGGGGVHLSKIEILVQQSWGSWDVVGWRKLIWFFLLKGGKRREWGGSGYSEYWIGCGIVISSICLWFVLMDLEVLWNSHAIYSRIANPLVEPDKLCMVQVIKLCVITW